MEEQISEAKELVSKYLSDDERLSKQKLAFLVQSEPRLLLIEGLKLLSLCIELDSCQANGCDHNTDELSVENFLCQNRILCPGLPLVVPDGFKMTGNVLIILECFVRSSPANFEQKYREDSIKLDSLKNDLSRIGVTMLPLIDGRTSFYTEHLPEWVNDRLRFLLFSLLSYSQESMKLFEEAEYARLCESLSISGNKRSGIENINTLQDHRAGHYDELLRLCHTGINNSMSPVDVKREVIQEFQAFRNKLRDGVLERQFRKVDQEELLSAFNNMYGLELREGQGETQEIMEAYKHANPIISFIYSELPEVNTSSMKDSYVPNWRALLNKVKSLKLLNTRRKLMLTFDSIILLVNVMDLRSKGKLCETEWLGSSFLSVNDRLVSLYSTQKELKAWLYRRVCNSAHHRNQDNMNLYGMFLKVINCVVKKASEALSHVGLNFSNYSVKELDLSEELFHKMLQLEVDGVEPTMNYEKNELDRYPYDIKEVNCDDNDDWKRLSSVSLALVNSMKTSSTAKIRQNEHGKSRFKIVRCREAYFQDFCIGGHKLKLIYQKTGECSKCYAINDSVKGEICSFYADPKRYFPAIFSQDVLQDVVDCMISWLSECSEIKDSLKELKLLTKMMIILILTNPTKRAQKLLQNLRYFIMAFVSEYYHKDLMKKLREDLITECEFLLYRIIRRVLNIVLNNEVKSMMTNRFKFVLNMSYLCHFITKETPDRLTDQIKCFEKFIEPKLHFGSVNVNPEETANKAELSSLISSATSFMNKPSCFGGGDVVMKIPGVSKKLFSLMVSSFNNGSLFRQSELKDGIKDPLITSGCATALDLASNKSVVVNKYKDGERVIEYDYDKLVATAVCQLSEVFMRKGKYVLQREEYDYRIQQVVSDLVIGRNKKREGDTTLEASDGIDEILLEGGASEYFERIKQSIDSVMNKFNWSVSNEKESRETSCDLGDLKDVISDKIHFRLIQSELSTHMVEDFDMSTLPLNVYQDICEKIYNNHDLRVKYFYLDSLQSCPITKIAQAICKRTYDDGEYFQCFKSILLQMNANKLSGKFNHYRSKCLNFKLDRDRLFDETRISERESNSEALSKALNFTDCATAALKNLCFYSQESPQSYTSRGPDTGRLKFSLSYKEQVGGNRELYIGDLRTKMFTRLIEDYFEALTSQFKGSCLNDEHEFENAILSMKINVSLGLMSYSLDHSKWGPMMSPFLFLAMLQNINWASIDTLSDMKSKDYVSTMLSWHIHKIVEVPFNVVTAMMKSFLKMKLGLKKQLTMTDTERFFFEHFQLGQVPSHISSILDMGQGILHNASDFYGLITERFINYCLSCLYDGRIDAYTSSDDQISLFDKMLSELSEKDPTEFEYILEFHNYLSDQLNKFISPKSVIGRFVAEFKSRFYVWGDEVPLLTKFVAASLHNIKCKEPHQLAETIDTIIDQAVANGVPISLCNKIQVRTLNLLRYAQYPIDPFLMNCNSDVKDWVDGNRGYRIMRNIEMIDPSGTKKIRSLLRRLYNKLKTGELHEEFTTAYLSGDPYESLQKLTTFFDSEPLKDEELGLSWLNLASYFPLRMVLRQKVVYTGAVNVEEEKLPTIVKTLQNKLSSSFTRGAQKLLSEAINKSAFQSSIASGFVGLCKTLGSKCVRGPERENLYIKSVTAGALELSNIERTVRNGMEVWNISPPFRTQHCNGCSLMGYFRPVLWDYLCIALSTALEIGSWVLGEPVIKSVLSPVNFRPCDYFPIKPSITKLLEDKVGFNHIIHSFRRLYPEIFEKHLLPFMSDLASVKMKWSPRIKFLDLCVMLDVNCEAMSLVSHIVKWKREEHYVVLSADLSVAHSRSHESMADERVVSTEDAAQNFLRQIYFESFVRPFVATSRTLGSFTWFPHKSSLPGSEGLSSLGPFGTFVEKVIYKGTERPMYRHDLFSGYSWLDFDIQEIYFDTNQFIRMGYCETNVFTSINEFLSELVDVETVQLSMTINFQIKSQGESLRERFSLYCRFKGVFDADHKYHLNDAEVMFGGSVNRAAIVDCWNLVMSNAHFSKSNSVWHVTSSNVCDYLRDSSMVGEVIPIEVVINRDVLRVENLNFERVGPETNVVPLTIEKGYICEGQRKLLPFNPSIHDQDLEVLIRELYDDNRDLLQRMLHEMLLSRNSQGLQWHCLDIIKVVTLCLPSDSQSFLKSVFVDLDFWIDFKGYSLCYSKSKSTVMIHSSEGNLRLKGKLCRELFSSAREIEEID
ncbi:polymerase [Mammarenavirus gairoense]|uniref:RNA-directed RNA polymerase L n=19 Tax=Mammarenavirus gairoense TaxID=3052306 RepID=A0A0B4N5G0_9VIRU|nr:polymerase [Mammarenavirus gairoense]AIK25571.1 polymerase [Mammarenavirus gairoense]